MECRLDFDVFIRSWDSSLAFTAERHPQLRATEGLLVKAQEHLVNAACNFGGHRVKAMEHSNAALVELRAANEFDAK